MAQAVRVLETISAASSDFKLKLETHDFGGCAIEAHGNPLPETTLTACQEADAILMGSSSSFSMSAAIQLTHKQVRSAGQNGV